MKNILYPLVLLTFFAGDLAASIAGVTYTPLINNPTSLEGNNSQQNPSPVISITAPQNKDVTNVMHSKIKDKYKITTATPVYSKPSWFENLCSCLFVGLRVQVDKYELRNKESKKLIDQANEDAKFLELRLKESQDNLETQKNRVTELEGQLGTSQKDFLQAQDALAAQRILVTALEGQLGTSQNDLLQAQDALEAQRILVTALESQLGTSQNDLLQPQRLVVELKASLGDVERPAENFAASQDLSIHSLSGLLKSSNSTTSLASSVSAFSPLGSSKGDQNFSLDSPHQKIPDSLGEKVSFLQQAILNNQLNPSNGLSLFVDCSDLNDPVLFLSTTSELSQNRLFSCSEYFGLYSSSVSPPCINNLKFLFSFYQSHQLPIANVQAKKDVRTSIGSTGGSYRVKLLPNRAEGQPLIEYIKGVIKTSKGLEESLLLGKTEKYLQYKTDMGKYIKDSKIKIILNPQEREESILCKMSEILESDEETALFLEILFPETDPEKLLGLFLRMNGVFFTAQAYQLFYFYGNLEDTVLEDTVIVPSQKEQYTSRYISFESLIKSPSKPFKNIEANYFVLDMPIYD